MIETDIQKLMKLVAKQNKSVPFFEESDNPLSVSEMIVEEAQELLDQVNELYKPEDLIKVASEIGDVLYLALKLCSDLGIEPNEALLMKIERNQQKYGGYVDGEKAKEDWGTDGDKVFYRAYLEYLADVDIS